MEEAGPPGRTLDELRDGTVAAAGTAATELDRALARLAAAGRAVEADGRWRATGFTGWEAGRLELLPSGDGLVYLTPSREPAYFVPRRRLQGAVAGDTVLVRRPAARAARTKASTPARADRPGRRDRDQRLPEISVVRVLSRRHETLVGTLAAPDPHDPAAGAGRRLSPFDARLPELEVTGGDGIPADSYVVVELERPSSRRAGGEPRGRVVEVLGGPEAPGVDVLVVLRHHRIPDLFPEAVSAAALAFPPDPRPQDWEGREDLRERTVITIDGPSARDFDDAVSIERLPRGVFRLGVHIADVAQYVDEGGVLDLEAYRRGTSVYYPERAVPMLPEGLSNGLCSLRPRVPRLTFSVFLDIDRDGQVLARRFAETVIRSSRRMTYDEVRRLLEEPRPDDRGEYGAILPALNEMRHLMEILNHARAVRGSIDFDLPEGDVALDSDGTMVGIFPEERHVAHRIVEEFMIAANEAVAYELVRHELPALFRVHDAPGKQRLEELRELLRTVGLDLPGELDELPPSALQEVLRQVKGRPEEHFVSTLVLRTQQRAFYSPECRGHYALASRYYTHFTSPIRRYPDLVVHRQLKALLRRGPEGARREAEATLLAGR
ncbi:MAG TPA: VacB/RNase II family 3'-5' exoribonuclease, partial [Thermoanaerobaculia bacterium]|nr:VacB/RNase II family 3'-5' exoribonuclease [Thermoanaerobaculia bacterium]